MDVDRKTFLWQLPRILNAIATAHFVSFDLELSGIPGKVGRKIRRFDEINGTKQTLQERYQEAKEAAGKYQVLQIGLTCVVEDNQSGQCAWRSASQTHIAHRFRDLYCSTVQFLPQPCS